MAICGFLRQSTADDVLIGPFVSSTDGATPQTGLTIDVEVSKNGQGLAEKSDATAPTHDGGQEVDGYYNCELDATDTNTVGILTLACFGTGALSVRHDYMVLEEAIYDALFAATANAFSGAAGSTTLTALATGSITAGVIANAAIDAATFAAGAIDASALAADAGTEIGTAVWATATRSLTVLDEDSTTLDLDATIRAAVGLAAANLDTQLDALPTAAENATSVWAAGTRTLTAIDEDSTTLDLDATIRAAVGLAAADLDTQLDTILADTNTILVDTAELQTDWTDGGRLDLILDARASQASVDDLPTNAELNTALAAADDAVLAAIAALNNLSAAQVNAEVVDALATDTYAEPGQGSPAATAALSAKIGYLYKAWRNRTTQTATEYALYADDGATKDQEAPVSDDATTFVRGEVVSGA